MTFCMDTEVILSQDILDNFVVIETKNTTPPPEAPKNLPDYRLFLPKDPHKLEREGKSHVPDIYATGPKLETFEEYRERMTKREILLDYMINCMKKM